MSYNLSFKKQKEEKKNRKEAQKREFEKLFEAVNKNVRKTKLNWKNIIQLMQVSYQKKKKIVPSLRRKTFSMLSYMKIIPMYFPVLKKCFKMFTFLFKSNQLQLNFIEKKLIKTQVEEEK